MNQVNIFQAKTDLSRLILSLEKREQDKIIIARDGVPVAMLSLYEPQSKKRLLGKFNGKFSLPDDLDACNDEVLELLGGTDQ